MSSIPSPMGDGEVVTFRKILEERSNRLTEQEVWAICKEAILSLRSWDTESDSFQSLCITPDSIVFDAAGGVNFIKLISDPDPMFKAPEFGSTGNTIATHTYSIGMSLWLAIQYGSLVASSPLRSLLADLTSEVAEERPDLSSVIALCDLQLSGAAADLVCNELAAAARWDTLLVTTDLNDLDNLIGNGNLSGSSSIARRIANAEQEFGLSPQMSGCESVFSQQDLQWASLGQLEASGQGVVRCTVECLALLREMCAAAIMLTSTEHAPFYERGLTPENIVLWEDGQVSLMEDPEGFDDETASKMAAPEVVEEGRFVWDKSLVYNLGVILCHVIDVDDTENSGRPKTDLGPRMLSESAWRLVMGVCRDQEGLRPGLKQVVDTADEMEKHQPASYRDVLSAIFSRCTQPPDDTNGPMTHNLAQPPETDLDCLTPIPSPRLLPRSRTVNGGPVLPTAILEELRTSSDNNNRRKLRRCAWPHQKSVLELFVDDPDAMSHLQIVCQKSRASSSILSQSSGSPYTLARISKHPSPSVQNPLASPKSYSTLPHQGFSYPSQMLTSTASDPPCRQRTDESILSPQFGRQYHAQSSSAFKPISGKIQGISDNSRSTLPPSWSHQMLPPSDKPHESPPEHPAVTDSDTGIPQAFTSPLTHFRPIVIRSDSEIRPTLQQPTLEDVGRKLASRLRHIKAQNKRQSEDIPSSHQSQSSTNAPPSLHSQSQTATISGQTQFRLVKDTRTGLFQLVPVGHSLWTNDGAENSICVSDLPLESSPVGDRGTSEFSVRLPDVGGAEEENTAHWLFNQPIWTGRSTASHASGPAAHGLDTNLDSQLKLTLNGDRKSRASSLGPPLHRSDPTDRVYEPTSEDSGLVLNSARRATVGPSGTTALLGSPLDRLFTSDSVSYQRTLAAVIRAVQIEFSFEGVMENGVEDLALAEYITSLVNLSWQTFSSAIRERHRDLHWRQPLLSQLYRLVNHKSPDLEAPYDVITLSDTRSHVIEAAAPDDVQLRRIRQSSWTASVREDNPPSAVKESAYGNGGNFAAGGFKRDAVVSMPNINGAIHEAESSNWRTRLSGLKSSSSISTAPEVFTQEDMESVTNVTIATNQSQATLITYPNTWSSVVNSSSSPNNNLATAGENVNLLTPCIVYCPASLKHFFNDISSFELGDISSDLLYSRLSQISSHIVVHLKQRSKTDILRKKMEAQRKSKIDQRHVSTQFNKDITEFDQRLELFDSQKYKFETLLCEVYGFPLNSSPSFVESIDGNTKVYLDTREDLTPWFTFHQTDDLNGLRAASPRLLIACLLTRSAVTSAFIHTFFFGFRYFTTPRELLTFLRDSLRLVLLSNDISGVSQCPIKKEHVVRRIGLLTAVWAEGFYEIDVSQDVQLKKEFHTFVFDEMCCHLSSLESVELSSLVTRCERSDPSSLWVLYFPLTGIDATADRKMYYEKEQVSQIRSVSLSRCKLRLSPLPDMKLPPVQSAPSSSNPLFQTPRKASQSSTNSQHSQPSFSLLDHTPSKLAEALTQLEQEWFKAGVLHPCHFLSSSQPIRNSTICDSQSKNVTSESVVKLSGELQVSAGPLSEWMQHCKNVEHWTTAEAVTALGSKYQVQVVIHLLSLAKFCCDLGNLCTTISILNGLDSPRLVWAPVWAHLPPRWALIRRQMGDLRSHVASREGLLVTLQRDSCLPLLPSPHLLLMQIRQAERGRFTDTKGWVKWNKIRSIVQLVDRIRLFQQVEYQVTSPLTPLLHQRIAHLSVLHLDTLLAQSSSAPLDLAGGSGKKSFLKKMKNHFHHKSGS